MNASCYSEVSNIFVAHHNPASTVDLKFFVDPDPLHRLLAMPQLILTTGDFYHGLNLNPTIQYSTLATKPATGVQYPPDSTQLGPSVPSVNPLPGPACILPTNYSGYDRACWRRADAVA